MIKSCFFKVMSSRNCRNIMVFHNICGKPFKDNYRALN